MNETGGIISGVYDTKKQLLINPDKKITQQFRIWRLLGYEIYLITYFL
jgi:hypothetical protein